MAKPADAKPIALSEQLGGGIEEVAGIVFLGNRITGTQATDQDIDEAFSAVGVQPTPERIAKVKALLAKG